MIYARCFVTFHPPSPLSSRRNCITVAAMLTQIDFSKSAYEPVLIFTLRARWLLIGLMLVGMLLAPMASIHLNYALLGVPLLFLAGFNLILTLLHRRANLSQGLVELGLLADVLSLSALLYLSGGITNPFASLYLPPILIAALVCSRYFAWALTLLAVTAFLLLSRFYLPLTIANVEPSWQFLTHTGGMWFTFSLSAALITSCIGWLMRALNEREQQLAQAHAQQQQNEQLLSFGIEAAHTAHKLSTPLNALLLLNDELQAHPNLPADIQQDLALMHSQLIQCRDVLWRMKPNCTPMARCQDIWLYATLRNQLSHWQNLRTDVHYQWQQHSPIEPDIRVHLDYLFWSAFLNILNNAADAGKQDIVLETEIRDNIFILGIRNRTGFLTESQLQQAGLNAQQSDKPAGLGIGVLLSHATLSRLNGSLTLHNHPDGGVYAEIRIPLILAAADGQNNQPTT